MSDPFLALLCVAAVGVILLLSELLGRLLHLQKNITRLSVHMAMGSIVAIVPLLFAEKWWPVGVASVALVSLFIGKRRGWLPSIHAARPESYGTVWFAVSALFLYLVAWDTPVLITIPLLVMAFADTAGVLVGELRRNTIPLPVGFSGKTWDGSIAVFAIAGMTVSLGWEAFGLSGPGMAFLVGLACAPVAALTEALSTRGTDNLTVPLSVSLTIFLILETTNQPHAVLLAEAAALAITAGAIRWKALRPDGAAGAFLIATWLLGGGGWIWTLPLVVFFILSSVLSQLSEKLRRGWRTVVAKGYRRDLAQVAANGTVAVAAFVSYMLGMPAHLAWAALLGAVATATSDTWATEIGTAYREEARLITTGERVPAGTSGGVTIVGTSGSVLGALVIGITALLLAPVSGGVIMLCAAAGVVGGLAGSIVDSLLGATVQVKFRCGQCGKATERRNHCDEAEMEQLGGWGFMDNDVVNAVTGLIGALVALFITALFYI